VSLIPIRVFEDEETLRLIEGRQADRNELFRVLFRVTVAFGI